MSKPEHFLYGLLLLICVALSVGGAIAGAAMSCSISDATRGGAVAVAISFAALFLNRNYGAVAYDLIGAQIPRIADLLGKAKSAATRATTAAAATPADQKVQDLATQIDTLEQKVTALKNALETKFNFDTRAQKAQNIYLALASVIGTLFWGFGDWAAPYLVTPKQCESAAPPKASSAWTERVVMSRYRSGAAPIL